MQKPNSYDETKVGGSYTPVELGGHHMIIKQVKETKSSSGKPMLVVLLDMAANDKQAGYASNEFANDIRPDKKWPNSCTQRILTEDQDGKCSRSFKSFMTAFEDSNGVESVWGDNFCAQFKNKKIGAVYGEVENTYNGKTTMRHELRWFCADSKADSAAIPAPKYEKKTGSGNAGGADDFVAVDPGITEDLPF